VSLLEARARAAEYRSKAYRGIDPVADKCRPQEQPRRDILTFEQASRKVHEQRRSTWSNGKHVDQWINTLFDHVFPIIGSKYVNEIGTPDILNVLSPIWTTKPETARRVKQRIATVLDWARVAGHRSGDNPAELIGDALPRHKREQQHHAALPYSEVPQFIGKLRAGTSEPITKLAFEFLILTAVRTTEVRKAQWVEVDVSARIWTIPGRHMKAGRAHVVPLSDRCLAILAHAKRLNPDQQSIFPDAHPGRTMSENRFLVARDALGYSKEQCTPHGFRSSFRDWAAEETTFPAEVAEMALAHTIKNKVEAAYRRGHLLAKRAELMEAWAAYATSD
jgi:integrase